MDKQRGGLCRCVCVCVCLCVCVCVCVCFASRRQCVHISSGNQSAALNIEQKVPDWARTSWRRVSTPLSIGPIGHVTLTSEPLRTHTHTHTHTHTAVSPYWSIWRDLNTIGFSVTSGSAPLTSGSAPLTSGSAPLTETGALGLWTSIRDTLSTWPCSLGSPQTGGWHLLFWVGTLQVEPDEDSGLVLYHVMIWMIISHQHDKVSVYIFIRKMTNRQHGGLLVPINNCRRRVDENGPTRFNKQMKPEIN